MDQFLLLKGFLVEWGVIVGSGRKWRVLEGGRMGTLLVEGIFFTKFPFLPPLFLAPPLLICCNASLVEDIEREDLNGGSSFCRLAVAFVSFLSFVSFSEKESNMGGEG